MTAPEPKFTDEDVKLLKEECEFEAREYGKNSGMEYRVGHVLALLARLEAAEKIRDLVWLEFIDVRELPKSLYDKMIALDEAWRKVAGK